MKPHVTETNVTFWTFDASHMILAILGGEENLSTCFTKPTKEKCRRGSCDEKEYHVID